LIDDLQYIKKGKDFSKTGQALKEAEGSSAEIGIFAAL
jgi:hypothetical protein